jgi:hypothetical protein
MGSQFGGDAADPQSLSELGSLEQLVPLAIGLSPRLGFHNGKEMTPAWRIETIEGAFLVLTRFDTDKPELRDRTLQLLRRFMIWKMATSFVLTAETWLGAEKTRSGDEALLAIARYERLAVVQRIKRGDAFGSLGSCGGARDRLSNAVDLSCWGQFNNQR